MCHQGHDSSWREVPWQEGNDLSSFSRKSSSLTEASLKKYLPCRIFSLCFNEKQSWVDQSTSHVLSLTIGSSFGQSETGFLDQGLWNQYCWQVEDSWRWVYRKAPHTAEGDVHMLSTTISASHSGHTWVNGVFLIKLWFGPDCPESTVWEFLLVVHCWFCFAIIQAKMVA